MSLRARLLAGMAFVAAILVLVSVVITVTTRDRLIAEVDGRLESFAPNGPDGAPAVARITISPSASIDPAGSPDGAPERISDAYEGYVDAGGTLRTRFAPNVGDEDYSAPAIDTADLPANGSRTFTTDSVSGDQTYRVLAQRDGDVTLITAFLLDDVRATISRLVVVEVLGFIVILAALGLVAWWVVHLGIRPVKEMTETATRIADGDLAVRVPETAPGTESGALAVALNQMLGRIGGALDERAHRRIACGGSWPTPRTSCARRSPRSAATPSSTAAAGSANRRRSTTPCGGRSRKRCAWVASSRRCCSWPSSTSNARSTCGRSTWRGWPRRRDRRPRRRPAAHHRPRGRRSDGDRRG